MNNMPNVSLLDNKIQKCFNKAIKTNNSNLLKQSIEQGADINYNENWAIIYVCTKGFSDLLNILLEHNIDPSINNNQCLFLSIINEYDICVKLLIQNSKIDPSLNDNFALSTAIHHNKYNIIKILINDSRVINELRKSNSIFAVHMRNKLLTILGDLDDSEENEWTLIELTTPISYNNYGYVYSWGRYLGLVK
jgi:hypothetical protein